MNGEGLRQYHIGRGSRGGQVYPNPDLVTATGPGHVTGADLTAQELARDFATFKTDAGEGYPSRRLLVTDGYEFMTAGHQAGWRSLASWGNDGWDLGSWPYVVFMVKLPGVGAVHDAAEGPFIFVTHVEGDLDFYRFPTNALRREALTYLFVWYAVAGGAEWAKQLSGEPWDSEDDRTWPAYVHGPYHFLEPASVGS